MRIHQKHLGYFLILPAMVIIGLFIFYPIIEAFRISLYNKILTKAHFHFGFDTYKQLFANQF